MKVEFNRLFEKIKSEGLTQKQFKENAGISGGTMGKLINNDSVTTNTICKICDYFHCMPDSFMKWIPDSDYIDRQNKKAELEAKIAELQAQKNNL